MADPVMRTIQELRAAGAPKFFERDPQAWKDKLKAEFEAESGRTLYPAQTEMFLIETAAYALSILGEACQTGVEQNTVVFAEGVHLENRAANVSTFRLLPQPATTTLEFRLSEPRLLDTAIPKGTRVAAGTAITFATDGDLIIPAGMVAAAIPATAEVAGGRWNGLGLGKVTEILDPIAYVVSAGNITDISGGADIEEQERFRGRAANALYKISKAGPGSGYREYVKEVHPDIIDVAVIKPEPGYIEIYPLMKGGVLPSAELKAEILEYLDPETRRPMGDYVSIHDPEAVVFNPTLTIVVSEASFDLEERAKAKTAEVFKQWQDQLGPQIARSDVTVAVKKLPTVIEVETGGFAYTNLLPQQFARLGTVTVNIVVDADD